MTEFKARLQTLVGPGANSDFSEAVGIHFTSLSRQISAGAVSDLVLSSLEFLEIVPVDRWPARWSKLAARRKALLAKQRAKK